MGCRGRKFPSRDCLYKNWELMALLASVFPILDSLYKNWWDVGDKNFLFWLNYVMIDGVHGDKIFLFGTDYVIIDGSVGGKFFLFWTTNGKRDYIIVRNNIACVWFDGLCNKSCDFPKKEIFWWLNGRSGEAFLHNFPF
jgi:hypothetical protein